MFSLYTVTITERLDQLANRLFGAWDGYVEAILDANPGLADDGLEVVAGAVLRVPQDAVSDGLEVIRIWA